MEIIFEKNRACKTDKILIPQLQTVTDVIIKVKRLVDTNLVLRIFQVLRLCNLNNKALTELQRASFCPAQIDWNRQQYIKAHENVMFFNDKNR